MREGRRRVRCSAFLVGFFCESLCLFVARKSLTNPGRGPTGTPTSCPRSHASKFAPTARRQAAAFGHQRDFSAGPCRFYDFFPVFHRLAPGWRSNSPKTSRSRASSSGHAPSSVSSGQFFGRPLCALSGPSHSQGFPSAQPFGETVPDGASIPP